QLTNEVEDSWDYTDDFDRDDGALGDDWEATGAGGLGVLEIVSNQATNTTSGVMVSRLVADVGSGDIEAEIENVHISASGNHVFGIVLRMPNAANRDGIYFQYARSTGQYAIVKRVSGSGTVLETLTEELPETPFKIRARAVGDQFQLYINDVLKLEATDPNTSLRTNEKVGVYLSAATASNSVAYDNFRIRDIGSEEPPEVELEITIEEGVV